MYPYLEILVALNQWDMRLIDGSTAAIKISGVLGIIDTLENRKLWKNCYKIKNILEDLDLIGLSEEDKEEIYKFRKNLDFIIAEKLIILNIPEYLYGFNLEKIFYKLKNKIRESNIKLFQDTKSKNIFVILSLNPKKVISYKSFRTFGDFEEFLYLEGELID